MERMTKEEGMTPEEYIAMVEKENKNLKLIQETNEKQIQNDIKERDELLEENKKLNKQIEQFKKGVKAGTNIIERLEEENKKLKEELSKLKERIDALELCIDVD